VTRLDHIGIAVPSIAHVLPFYESLGGCQGSLPEHIASQGVNVVFVGEGEGRIELIEPTRAESPVARFLERRGAGLHHLAYRVTDLRGALADWAARGHELIDREPRPGAHGRLVAFLHPRSTHGVLIELVQDPPSLESAP
jgi:methylmalonyl-CoA/ethylmalonyl-CoA epimerase